MVCLLIETAPTKSREREAVMPTDNKKLLRDRYADLQLSMGQIKGGRSGGGATEAFVLKVAEMLFSYGVECKASDLHLEPSSNGAHVRYRIDGILHDMLQIAPEVRDPLVRAIKVKANMSNDAIGRSKPQDGRINFQINGKAVDLRLNAFPTLYGDVLAIRLLDRSSPVVRFEEIGFPAAVSRQFDQALHRPNGLFLVTGPANSGKTTTLYAALNKLRSPQIKIVTLEDPVEYQMDGVNQAQINPDVGLTFASGLRAILRQDANVIFVGEIRDKETAEIAVRAALTGHCVFSTLHTRHSFGAILRLIDMGIDEHLLVGAINGVMAQRLLRKVCLRCKTEDPEAGALFVKLWKRETGKEPPSMSASRFVKGEGCEACRKTGYQTRCGIFELLVLNAEMKRLIIERNTRELYKVALAAGMATMMMDGLAKASEGITTVREVLRVTGETSSGL